MVRCLALGHIHKSYHEPPRHQWVYNPGSIENRRADEADWPRGFYHVVVDTAADPPHQVRRVLNPRRPFHRVWLEVDRLQSPDVLYDAVRESVEKAGICLLVIAEMGAAQTSLHT